jgi:hypothetical protein
LIQAQLATYKNFGIDALLWPRNAGSYPGYVFTGEPLKLAAGHFGLGHGSGAHAPDEYYIIESTKPEDTRLRWRRDVLCGIPLRIGEVTMKIDLDKSMHHCIKLKTLFLRLFV